MPHCSLSNTGFDIGIANCGWRIEGPPLASDGLVSIGSELVAERSRCCRSWIESDTLKITRYGSVTIWRNALCKLVRREC